MSSKQPVSQQTKDEALAVAKANQRPGQTKEQTKLIAAGIEKGISEFKKQHKAKQREQDKARKKGRQVKKEQSLSPAETELSSTTESSSKLPWILLVLSWLGVLTYTNCIK
ncbi:DUF2956 domain-containing protein [Psychrobium sp. nBUS_13]|uniref:DUF2956 domain-containing protein n=1 Tax=Psychrobium sp. nBUS_13 TaxID=3395319 RepID=UPI003EBB44B1